MRLSTIVVLFTIGVSIVQAIPAGRKIDVGTDVENSNEKNRFKKSLPAKETFDLEKTEEAKEALDEKERSKKSTTTFCVEIRPGSNDPMKSECNCGNKEHHYHSEKLEELRPRPDHQVLPIKPAPLPISQQQQVYHLVNSQVQQPAQVHVVKPMPQPQQPTTVHYVKPQQPSQSQPCTVHVHHQAPAQPQPQQVVHLIKPQPQPQPQQIVHVVKPEPQPAPQQIVHLVKPEPQPTPQQIVHLVKPEPQPAPQQIVHVVKPEPQPAPQQIVHVVKPEPQPAPQQIVHVVKPEPQPAPQQIVHVVKPEPQPAPQQIVHVVKPEPQPAPKPVQIQMLKPEHQSTQPCEVHYVHQTSQPTPRPQTVHVVHEAPQPAPRPQAVHVVHEAPQPAPRPQAVHVVHEAPQPAPRPQTVHVVHEAHQPAPRPQAVHVVHEASQQPQRPQTVHVVHQASQPARPIQPLNVLKPQIIKPPHHHPAPQDCGDSASSSVVMVPSQPIVVMPQHPSSNLCPHHHLGGSVLECNCHSRPQAVRSMSFRSKNKGQSQVYLLPEPSHANSSPVVVQCNPRVVPVDSSSDLYVSARSNDNMESMKRRLTMILLDPSYQMRLDPSYYYDTVGDVPRPAYEDEWNEKEIEELAPEYKEPMNQPIKR